MINGLMEWSRNIVCFSIFAVLIKNLLAEEKYLPYVRLYMGFIMLLVFFTPILKILDADVTLQYLTEILGGTLEIKEDSFLASIQENSNLERQKEEYTNRLEGSVTDYLTECLGKEAAWQGYLVEQVNVKWEEAEESKAFGTLTGITVHLKKEESRKEESRKKESREEESEAEQEEKAIQIDPIFIEVFSEVEQEEQERIEESGQLKHLLAQFYHLKEENITVRIAE